MRMTITDERAVPPPGPGWTQRSDRTYNDTRQLIAAAISATLPTDDDGEPAYVWVQDLTDEWAIYQPGGGDLLQVDYSIDDDGNVTLGDPVVVVQTTSYEPKGVPKPKTRVMSGRALLYGTSELRSEARGYTEPFVRCVRQMDPDQRVSGRFEMREVSNGTGGTALMFTGYAAVVERAYEMEDMFGPYTETVARDAFDPTLRENPDVNFLCNHAGVSMARTKPGTLKLSADATGLYSEARLNPSRSDVMIIRAAVEDGDLDEMSFAFRCTRQEWDEDYENRLIKEVSLHQGDVSIVNYGANPHTAGLVAVRSRAALARLQHHGALAVVQNLIEWRKGKTLSADTMSTLKQVLALVSDADDDVDQAQILLAQMMGVPNPDDDTQWDTGEGDKQSNSVVILPNHVDRAKADLARMKGKR